MALDPNRLKNALTARMKTLWRSEAPANEAQNEDYFLDQLSQIIAEEIINEFTGFAQCSGNDSNGDTHNNVGLV